MCNNERWDIREKFFIVLPNLEVRKVIDDSYSFSDKNGKLVVVHSLVVCFDDDDAQRIELRDKDMSHLDQYKIGSLVNVKLRIDIDESNFKKPMQCLIAGFEEVEKKEQ